MGCVAKSKKVKLSKMKPEEALKFLFIKFIQYLRGDEMIRTSAGSTVFECDVTWNDNGTFKPSEKAIAEAFGYLNRLWISYVMKMYRPNSWDKYKGLFKQAVSEEWRASKKSTSTETESQY